jgi:hypothetical protein
MCQVISNSLPATRTYKTRSLMWVSATDPTLPQLGTLTVLRGRAPTTYLVGFDDADPREVLLAKQDAAADVYAVRLTPAGQACGCTCPGFRFTGRCVHRDAVATLVGEGAVPVPAVPVPALSPF